MIGKGQDATKGSRIYWLDNLRTFMIFLVALIHAGVVYESSGIHLIRSKYGVCATGGMEEKMTDWGVDVILTAAQKCFGVPPGLAVLVLSEKAMAKRNRMPSIPAYYADLLR